LRANLKAASTNPGCPADVLISVISAATPISQAPGSAGGTITGTAGSVVGAD
jgi:hypothetical protein